MKSVSFLFVFILSVFLLPAFAQDDKMNYEMMQDNMMIKIDKDDNNVAIKGYDPVAYFTDGKPVMGKPAYKYNWNGAEWHFANEEHLEMFTENPAKYAPQYGGFCAYGMVYASYFSTQPDVWKIVDGKLYLNKNKETGEGWKKDIKGNIEKADKNWTELSSEK
jgi:YHS domain-containing protein